jgi:DNA-binding cell septation regulator SpoVG
MNVNVTQIQRSAKPHRLADATVVLSDVDGDSLVISDVRILQNKQGQVWVAMPSRSVSDGGRSYQYVPVLEAVRQLQRKIEDAVLSEYELWQRAESKSGVRS